MPAENQPGLYLCPRWGANSLGIYPAHLSLHPDILLPGHIGLMSIPLEVVGGDVLGKSRAGLERAGEGSRS